MIIYYFITSQTIILVFFIKRAILYIANNQKVNLFHAVLLLYVLTIILKFFVRQVDVNAGSVYFVVTGMFEILIAVFFTIFREDNPRLLIELNRRDKTTGEKSFLPDEIEQ